MIQKIELDIDDLNTAVLEYAVKEYGFEIMAATVEFVVDVDLTNAIISIED